MQRAFQRVPTEDIALAKQTELDRLDRIERHLLGVMEKRHVAINNQGAVLFNGEALEDDDPGVRAAQALLRLAERRSKLLGLDAPSRRVTFVVTEEVVRAEIEHIEQRLREANASTPADA